MPKPILNSLQSQTLEYIITYQRYHNARPSFRIVALALGCSLTSVVLNVNKLEVFGYLELQRNESGHVLPSVKAVIMEADE